MKHLLPSLPVVLSTVLSVAATHLPAARAGEPISTASPTAATQEIPFLTCTLAALSDRERPRHAALLGRLRTAIVETRELPDGYAFRLGPDFPLADLAEWISLERRCCAFFGFAVEAKPGENDLWLRLTGGGDVKAFIRGVVLADGSAAPATAAPAP